MSTTFSLVQLDILREALKTDTVTEVSLRYSKRWRVPVKTVFGRIKRLLKAESKIEKEEKDTRPLLNLSKLKSGVKLEEVLESNDSPEVPITTEQRKTFDLVRGIQAARARGAIGASTVVEEEVPPERSEDLIEAGEPLSPKVTVIKQGLYYSNFNRMELFPDHVIIYF